MAQRCDICGKGPQFGNRVSHAHNVTHRRFNPNLQSSGRPGKGTHRRVRVCTRCLRSGKVTKPARTRPRQQPSGSLPRPQGPSPTGSGDRPAIPRQGGWGDVQLG